MKSKWNYSGDKNMLDYGGKNVRRSGDRQFQVVELINMDDACGRDNEGQPKYIVELRLVDLNAISAANIKSALECCGQDRTENPSDELLSECCDAYGTHAMLGTWKGNNARKLLRLAYREANALLKSESLEAALDKPVNKIGSTAREAVNGDFVSAMQRGCEAGRPDARIMAKMHGIPQQVIDDARPMDWFPYWLGYMDAANGSNKETDPDTSPEYFRGYERGLAVKAGTAPEPGWIKSANK